MINLINNTRRHDIILHRSGRIDINARLARLLSLVPGDVINLCQEGIEVYLFVYKRATEVIGRHEARCYPSKNSSHNFRAYSRTLCSVVFNNLSQVSPTTKKLRLFAGNAVTMPNGVLGVPIIYKLIVPKQ